jgi:hypothetical protein
VAEHDGDLQLYDADAKMIQYDAPEVRKITLNTKRSSEGLGVVDDEHID